MEAYSWQPHTAAQRAALDSQAQLLLFGGSAGSLKSETICMDAVQERMNPNLRAIIFRETYPQLSEIVTKTQRLYRPFGAKYNRQTKTWKFPSGAEVRLGYLESDDDVYQYWGQEYSWMGWDESTRHTEFQIRTMLSRLRSTDASLRVRARLATNPGGVGAGFHRSLFLRGHCPVHAPQLAAQPGKVYTDGRWSDGAPIPLSIAFIPGKITDHSLLGENYIRLLRMQSGALAEQLEKGCWCKLEGAYFSFLTTGLRLPRAEVGEEWWHNHFIAIDYGFGKSSAAAGLYVRTPAESAPAPSAIQGIDPRLFARPGEAGFPQGRIRKIAEIVAPHLAAYEFAQRVVEEFIAPSQDAGLGAQDAGAKDPGSGAQRRRIVAAYLDPANFKEIGDGHTIADQINEVLEPWGVACERASNDRAGGWQLLYKMLKTGEFQITDACPQTFEALRTRMVDEKKTEDIKKVPGDPLDDVADETRYALYTFVNQAAKPRELLLEEAVAGLDLTSAAIRYQQKAEELDRLEQPPRMAGRMGFRRRR